MSCGGHMLSGFTCRAGRFDKYKFTTDKPSNAVLHQENQKKLSDLLQLREEQDKGMFQPISILHQDIPNQPIKTSFVDTSFVDTSSVCYYPTSDVVQKCKQE